MSAKERPADPAQGEKAKQKESLPQKLIKGMSHPLRVRILAYMNERPWSPRELESELSEGLSQVSYHVKVLFELELIELVKTEPVRGAVQHFYKAVARAFIPSSMTKHIPLSAQRILGDDTLKNLDDDLRASLKSGRFYARPDWHASWTPADMDNKGCQDAERLADDFIEKFLQIEAESAKRRAECEDGGEHISISAGVLVFGSERGDALKAPSRKPTEKGKKKANTRKP